VRRFDAAFCRVGRAVAERRASRRFSGATMFVRGVVADRNVVLLRFVGLDSGVTSALGANALVSALLPSARRVAV
jgi:hypothetical protein